MTRGVSVHVPAWRWQGTQGRWDAGGQAVRPAAGAEAPRAAGGAEAGARVPEETASLGGEPPAGTWGASQWRTEEDGKLPERDEVLGRYGCLGSGNTPGGGCRAPGVCPSRAPALAPGPPAGRTRRWASARDQFRWGQEPGPPRWDQGRDKARLEGEWTYSSPRQDAAAPAPRPRRPASRPRRAARQRC